MSQGERIKAVARRVRWFVRHRALVVALIIAVGAAVGITVVSVTIYNLGGFYRYDLSRPGYEKERTEIAKTPQNVVYDTTSPITDSTVQEFVKDLDIHSKNITDYTSFGNGSLSDEDLQLVPRQPASQ